MDSDVEARLTQAELMTKLLALVVLVLLSLPAEGRSRVERSAFVKSHPCPVKVEKGCPGWVVDHIVPLCKGGADKVWNMQWQSVEAGKAKDRWECRRGDPS